MSALFAATYPEQHRRSSCTAATHAGNEPPTTLGPVRRGPGRLAPGDRAGLGRSGGPRDPRPSAAHDERFMRFWASYLVQSASPQAALTLARMNAEIDVRPILSAIRVPTLILHREGDRVVGTEDARYLAEQIPSAELVLLAGDDHLPWVGDQDAVLDEVEECPHGHPPGARLGPGARDGPVHRHRRLDEEGRRARRHEVEGFAPRARRASANRAGSVPRVEVKTTGDGFLASFDGPARAVGCAHAIADGVRNLGIEIQRAVTPGRSSCSTATSAGSRCISELVSQRSPAPARCSCPAR